MDGRFVIFAIKDDRKYQAANSDRIFFIALTST
jgi:hypothetical protein